MSVYSGSGSIKVVPRCAGTSTPPPLRTQVACEKMPGGYLTRGLVLSSSPHWCALYFFTSAMYLAHASLLPGSACRQPAERGLEHNTHTHQPLGGRGDTGDPQELTTESGLIFFATMPVFRKTPPRRLPTWGGGDTRLTPLQERYSLTGDAIVKPMKP